MTHKPDGKRLGWWSCEWLLAAMLFAPYIGAYYATYTMPIGIMVGTVPHYQYKIGSRVLPSKSAYYLFYPAHWIDRHLRPREVSE